MKRIVFYFLILLLSVWLGLELRQDAGYVLFSYHGWTIETTLWLALLSLFLLFILIYWLVRLISSTCSLSDRFKLWLERRHLHKARKQTSQGLCDFAEGSWEKAEKKLTKAAQDAEAPLINYLAAARAAQARGAYDMRDTYLKYARRAADSEIAVGLTQAQLQLSGEQLEQASATLKQMRNLVPKHTYVLQLLQKAYLELRDWKSLEELLPDLRKRKVLPEAEFYQLQQKVYLELLEAAAKKDVAKLTLVWEKVPKDLLYDEKLLAKYVNYLNEYGQGAKAEMLLRYAIKKNWHDKLVELYGLVAGASFGKQLVIAESWLKKHPEDPTLLLTLGRLCMRQRLWGKARSYLETSLKIKPNAAVYKELGQIMDKLGDSRKALEYYRQGLQLLVEP